MTTKTSHTAALPKGSQGTAETINLVKVRDVLTALANDQESTAMVDIAMSVLSQASKTIDDMSHENAWLRKCLFGRRSEKIDPNQVSLFAQTVGAAAADSKDTANEAIDSPTKVPKKRKATKRRPLTPTQSHEIKVSDDDRPCPVCKTERCTIGHVKSVVVEYVPAKIEVIEYQREKIACKPCQGEVAVAPGPPEKLIERASPGPNILAAITVQKAVDGLPLNRIRQSLRSGWR